MLEFRKSQLASDCAHENSKAERLASMWYEHGFDDGASEARRELVQELQKYASDSVVAKLLAEKFSD